MTGNCGAQNAAGQRDYTSASVVLRKKKVRNYLKQWAFCTVCGAAVGE
jgi:hypothetical protein